MDGASRPVALLVEDTISHRDQIGEMLELAGYDVLIAANFIEASNYIQSRQDTIAVAIVDLVLGEYESKEGIKLFQPLRDHGIPFIVKSVYADRDDVRKAFLEYDASDFWFKDADDIDYLLQALARLADKLSRTLSDAGVAESPQDVDGVLRIVSGLNIALVITSLVAIVTYRVGSTPLFALTIAAFTVVALLALILAVPQTRKDVLPSLERILEGLLRLVG